MANDESRDQHVYGQGTTMLFWGIISLIGGTGLFMSESEQLRAIALLPLVGGGAAVALGVKDRFFGKFRKGNK